MHTPPSDWIAFPSTLMKRKDLSPPAKLVACAMMLCGFRSYSLPKISASHQIVASMCGLSRYQVLRAINHLCLLGVLRKDGNPVHQVQPYIVETTVIEAGRASGMGGIACASCQATCRKVNRAGYCRTCVRDREIERKVRA